MVNRHFAQWMMMLCLTLLLPGWAWAATITTHFDRNPVALGDPVTLVFTVDGVVEDEPNFAPLQQDFDLAGRSQSSSFQMVNGVSKVRTEWELRLYPRHSGNLTVPAIHFGNDQSQPTQLQVLDQPPVGTGSNSDLFIELEVQPTKPYVQQQVLLTQRLYHVAPLRDQATLTHPTVSKGKGSIQQIGGTRNWTTLRDGHNYLVAERRYALTPEQSGELSIGATAFEGVLEQPGASSQGQFDPFDVSGKRIRRYSKPLAINVQPQPSKFSGKQWLPSRTLTLNAYWQTPADKLKAGEPVTLTLAIMADGLAAEQLPKLDVQAPAGVKAYSDQPELRNDASGDGVIGIRQEKWVLVAPYNGTYTLPAIKLDWWDVVADKQQTATIPPTKMVVTGGQPAPAGAASEPSSQPATDENKSQPDQTARPAADLKSGADDEGISWARLAAMLLLGWIVLTLLWMAWRWFRSWKANRRAGRKLAVVAAPGGQDAKAILRQLEQACQQNKSQAAHDALLRWIEVGLKIRPPLISRLRQLADPALQAAIDELNNNLYGRGDAGWRGADLWQAIRDFKPAGHGHSTDDSGLAKMYPD